MKITFKRYLKLYVYHTLLTLKFEEERLDVQKFVEAYIKKELPNDGNTGKIIRYLKQIGLLDAKGSLTSEGQRLVDTGLYPVSEQGVYRAWITSKDALLGSRIIALNRVSIHKNDKKNNQSIEPKPELLPFFNNIEQHLLLATEDSKHPQSYQVRRTNAILLNDNFLDNGYDSIMEERFGIFIHDWDQSSNINETPAIELSASKGDEQTSVNLQGKCNLKIRDRDTGCEGDLSLLNSDLEPLNYSFQDLAEKSFTYMSHSSYKFQRWDDQELALRVKYTDLTGEERDRGIRGIMEFEVKEGFYGGSGTIVATDLPLLADNVIEAEKWRNDLFFLFLQKEYRLPNENEKYLEELQHNFSPISCQLENKQLPTENELNEIVSIKNTTKAYWHYYAPIDLKPLL